MAIPSNSKPEGQPHLRRTRAVAEEQADAWRLIRGLHVAIDEQVFNHAKAQAYLSGLPWPEFVERVLKASNPIKQ